MLRSFCFILSVFLTFSSYAQKDSIDKFLSDSSLVNASVSLCFSETETGKIIKEYNSGISLTPASVMKLITSAAALELLGPHYTFKTKIGYTGSINKITGKLNGDIIITGGGDPALGSQYFSDNYKDFITQWADEIRNTGIKKIEGRILTDDSYYDFQPAPAKWLWEDTGNYYGAGVYGLSVFDNIYNIHFTTGSDSSTPVINEVIPSLYKYKLENRLIAAGSSDEGYVFAAPYSTNGWISGSIPPDKQDFVLKASITDPPLLLAKIINDKLEEKGIKISKKPSTIRLEKKYKLKEIIPVTETISPALSDIIFVLNHESVNLFAEHFLKELGKKYKNSGTTKAGIDVVMEFLDTTGISTRGMFIEDGSGLSPLNSINSAGLVSLLNYMAAKSRYFQ